MRLAIDLLLAAVVLGAWIGCAGFARLRSPFDRMHCVAFVNTVSGSALTIAAFLADGASIRACKILLITVVSLLAGAAMSHVTGRALLLRGPAPAAEPAVGENR